MPLRYVHGTTLRTTDARGNSTKKSDGELVAHRLIFEP
jgi:hypothetical protein